MYGHKQGCGLACDKGAWPKWKPYDSTRIVLSLGPDWVSISLSTLWSSDCTHPYLLAIIGMTVMIHCA